MKRHCRTALIGFIVLVAPTALLLAARQEGPTGTPRIPLRVGLTIVTALNQPGVGDYESLKVIVQTNDKDVRLKYSADVPAPEGGDNDNPLAAILAGGKRQTTKNADGSSVRQIRATRTIARSDLEAAGEYRLVFGDGQPESFPDSTAVGVSRRVFTDLKEKGKATLSVPSGGLSGGIANLVGALLGEASKEFGLATMRAGSLERVAANPVPFKVLVNDQPTELPAIRARGTFEDAEAEFWLLDDADNPLALKWTIGDDKLQVIRLSYPMPVETERPSGAGGSMPAGGAATSSGAGAAGSGAGSGSGGRVGSGAGAGGAAEAGGAAAGTAKRIEADLEKEGRAVVYGIYFDFASDRIKEESEPVLAEIAQVLQQNPAWHLNVEGHTDSIGGTDYNQNLSERRSAAVKQALTARYKIDSARLQTSGYGLSRPKERNDTIEGRARNRRVELVKAQ